MADSRSYGQGGPYRSDDGPSAPQGSKPNTDSRIGAIQTEIDQTVSGLHSNLEMVKERGGALNTLVDKSSNLADSSSQFRRGANRVRKQMWWKDMKMRMCLIAGIIILLLVIIIPSVVATRH